MSQEEKEKYFQMAQQIPVPSPQQMARDTEHTE